MSISLPLEVLQKYPNDYFIETGTFEGGGVIVALQAGFPNVRSVEVYPVFYQGCVAQFQNDPRVKLYLGDSIDLLDEMISDIAVPATFWLDGHVCFYPGVTVGKKNIPIIEELEIISRHPVKTHTLLIDDRRVMGTSMWDGITEAQVLEGVMKINPDYKISYDNSYNAANDILVAKV